MFVLKYINYSGYEPIDAEFEIIACSDSKTKLEQLKTEISKESEEYRQSEKLAFENYLNNLRRFLTENKTLLQYSKRAPKRPKPKEPPKPYYVDNSYYGQGLTIEEVKFI